MSVLFFIQSVKEHGLRKVLEDFVLKYRSEDYRFKEVERGESSSAQSVSSIVPDYAFSEKEGTVVQVGEKDNVIIALCAIDSIQFNHILHL